MILSNCVVANGSSRDIGLNWRRGEVEMGREIKRVALDFDYPINKMIWKGYHNPFSGLACAACGGIGESSEVQVLSEDWYGFERPEKRWCHDITQDEVQALIDAGRLMDFTRVPRNEEQKKIVEKKIAEGGNSWLPFNNEYTPSAKEVNDWSRKGVGHDGVNRWICVKARAKRMGITQMVCELCNGEGQLWPAGKYEKLWNEFERVHPPEGEGYQLWSTTTEGTPMSPVFATPEELAKWLYENRASSFGTATATYEEWLKFYSRPWLGAVAGLKWERN